jgi:hypothetical protein
MKTIATSLAALALCAVAFIRAADPAPAGTDIETKVAQTLKTYTPPEFDTKKESLDGQIIKLKFTSRETDIRENKDGVLIGSVRNYDTKNSKAAGGSGYLTVSIPKEQKEWFTKITTNYEGRVSFTVIGKVKKGLGYYAMLNGYGVELLGREIKTDMKGSKIVW